MAAGLSPPIIAVVGWSGSGKTTLIERLVPALRSLGVARVAAIKHTQHQELDASGKDTDRFRRAGISTVGLVGPAGCALYLYEDQAEGLEGLMEIISPLGPFDLILLEGFKRSRWPKIEVVRKSIYPELVSSPEELVAVVADFSLPCGVPQFGFGEEDRLAAFVVDRLKRNRPGGKTGK